MENLIKKWKKIVDELEKAENGKSLAFFRASYAIQKDVYKTCISDLERALAEPATEASGLSKHAVNNCYADDCLIQDSCLRFKQKGCNKECKLYA